MRMQSAFWAPLRDAAMCGPSRWMPGRRAPGTSRVAEHTRSRSSRYAVIDVGSHVVVPCLARKTAILAKSASIVSSPRHPCAWTSTRPGMAISPLPSMSPGAAGSAPSSIEATRSPSNTIERTLPPSLTLTSFFIVASFPLRAAPYASA